MKRIIIFHGTCGSPDGNWFPWLSEEFSKEGYDVFIPKMPTPENQSLENWFKSFYAHCEELLEDDILIGHSLGAVFILRLLEQSLITVKAAVYVSGFTGKLELPDFDSLNYTFIEEKFAWEKIRSGAREHFCIYGEDDPYVPLAQSCELANFLGVESVMVPAGGHLNIDSGYAEFPLLLDIIHAF
jgi:predicted alpha/beta hydrolase family esterase